MNEIKAGFNPLNQVYVFNWSRKMRAEMMVEFVLIP